MCTSRANQCQSWTFHRRSHTRVAERYRILSSLGSWLQACARTEQLGRRLEAAKQQLWDVLKQLRKARKAAAARDEEAAGRVEALEQELAAAREQLREAREAAQVIPRSIPVFCDHNN